MKALKKNDLEDPPPRFSSFGVLQNKYLIAQLSPPSETELSAFIRQNLEEFDHQEKILVATYRRLNHLKNNYSQKGNKLYIIRDRSTGSLIACAGLGPLHGLPVSEQIGEIRDLIVNKKHRRQGLGKILLSKCIEIAKKLGYRQLYLETSKNMIVAQRLFMRYGFRAVTELPQKTSIEEELPSYFLLEKI